MDIEATARRSAWELDEIASLHRKTEAPGGMTDGFCAECGRLWPCQTAHLANGWGKGDGGGEGDCFETGWCSHVVGKVAVLYE